jgi:hypothetical protein
MNLHLTIALGADEQQHAGRDGGIETPAYGAESGLKSAG